MRRSESSPVGNTAIARTRQADQDARPPSYDIARGRGTMQTLYGSEDGREGPKSSAAARGGREVGNN